MSQKRKQFYKNEYLKRVAKEKLNKKMEDKDLDLGDEDIETPPQEESETSPQEEKIPKEE